jgi:hypothetical protein
MCKRQQLSVSAIFCAVQYARRYHGYEYAKSVTASACSAPTVEEVDEEDEFLTRADKEKNMAIDERMFEQRLFTSRFRVSFVLVSAICTGCFCSISYCLYRVTVNFLNKNCN